MEFWEWEVYDGESTIVDLRRQAVLGKTNKVKFENGAATVECDGTLILTPHGMLDVDTLQIFIECEDVSDNVVIMPRNCSTEFAKEVEKLIKNPAWIAFFSKDVEYALGVRNAGRCVYGALLSLMEKGVLHWTFERQVYFTTRFEYAAQKCRDAGWPWPCRDAIKYVASAIAASPLPP